MSLAKIAPALALAGFLAGGGAAYLARPTLSAARSAPAGPASTATPSAASPATPSAAPSMSAAAGRFENWMDGTGGSLLENGLGVLADARADAEAENVAKLEVDGGALAAAGNAALADPPPSFAANWNAAFAAMVRAGQDLTAGNLLGAKAESGTVQAEISAFNARMS